MIKRDCASYLSFVNKCKYPHIILYRFIIVSILIKLSCYAVEFFIKLKSVVIHMNNPGRPPFLPFHLTQRIRINVHVDRKVFYQQRIVFMFGAERLREILDSPLPVIIPMIHYKNSFDVHVFILL